MVLITVRRPRHSRAARSERHSKRWCLLALDKVKRSEHSTTSAPTWAKALISTQSCVRHCLSFEGTHSAELAGARPRHGRDAHASALSEKTHRSVSIGRLARPEP